MGCRGSKTAPPPTERELEEEQKANTARAEASAADVEHKKAEARAKEANNLRSGADERIARLNSSLGKEQDGHAAEEVAFAALGARQRAISTAANDCKARGDALRATFDAAAEARDDSRNQGITLEAELKEATPERDAANKAAGVLQAKLDAATADIESNAIILESKDEHIQTLIKTPKGK